MTGTVRLTRAQVHRLIETYGYSGPGGSPAGVVECRGGGASWPASKRNARILCVSAWCSRTALTEVLQRSLPAGGRQDRASLRLPAPPLPLAARGENQSAFDERRILAACVAPSSNTGGILSRRALSTRRLARLGATPDFHHGLLEGRKAPSEPFGNSGQQPPRSASACRKRPFTTHADRLTPASQRRACSPNQSKRRRMAARCCLIVGARYMLCISSDVGGHGDR